MGHDGTRTFTGLHVLRCETEECNYTVGLDPRTSREQRAEALEGWIMVRGEVHCPEHSIEPPPAA